MVNMQKTCVDMNNGSARPNGENRNYLWSMGNSSIMIHPRNPADTSLTGEAGMGGQGMNEGGRENGQYAGDGNAYVDGSLGMEQNMD